jgi:RNA polymerase sigma-70 factor (family 1)
MLAPNETDLLARLRQPETRHQAFEAMVRSYQRPLYYHIRRMVDRHEDADDVLQNTFLKAWHHLDRFRGDSALKTWLYRIATNESLNFLRQQKRRAMEPAGESLENDLRHSRQEGTIPDSEEIQRHLQAAIQTLPERQRMVFSLRYFEEMKYEEMAAVLEVSVGGLKASYHHAVKKVEHFLKAQLT